MSDETDAIAKKRIVVEAPGAESLVVRRDIEIAIGGGASIALDIYQPAKPASGAAVVIVAGYPDRGFQSFAGCRFKEMGWTVSWAELIAAAGITALTYSAPDPMDVHKLLQQIRGGAIEGIDAARIGVLASSGNGPMAMSLLEKVRCAALLYAYTIDIGGSTAVADAAKMFRFANPARSDLRDDVPLFIARAGRDETPRLNEALDAFVTAALSRNVPLTLMNHANAPHAFDLTDDTETTRDAIRQVVGFFAKELGN